MFSKESTYIFVGTPDHFRNILKIIIYLFQFSFMFNENKRKTLARGDGNLMKIMAQDKGKFKF